MLFTWCVSNLRSCPKGKNNGRNAQFHCFSSAMLIYVQSSHCYWLNAIPCREARLWAEPQPSESHVIPRQVCAQVALLDSSALWAKNIPSRVLGPLERQQLSTWRLRLSSPFATSSSLGAEGRGRTMPVRSRNPGVQVRGTNPSEVLAGCLPPTLLWRHAHKSLAEFEEPLGRFLKFLFTHSDDGRDSPVMRWKSPHIKCKWKESHWCKYKTPPPEAPQYKTSFPSTAASYC